MTDHYITVMGYGGPLDLDRVCTRCAALIMQARPDLPDGTPTPEAVHDEFHDRINLISESLVGLLGADPVKPKGGQ